MLARYLYILQTKIMLIIIIADLSLSLSAPLFIPPKQYVYINKMN